jgi:SH3-like domain-containing protein
MTIQRSTPRRLFICAVILAALAVLLAGCNLAAFTAPDPAAPDEPVETTGETPAAEAPPTLAPDCVTVSSGGDRVNVRSGPGTGYPVVTQVDHGDHVTGLARNEAGSWLMVRTTDGSEGWIAANLLSISCGAVSELPVEETAAAAASAGSSVTASPLPPEISFTASAAEIAAGDCVTITWATEHIQEVYYNGEGVVGDASREECPAATTTYTLDVLLQDDTWEQRTLTVTVAGVIALHSLYIQNDSALPATGIEFIRQGTSETTTQGIGLAAHTGAAFPITVAPGDYRVRIFCGGSDACLMYDSWYDWIDLSSDATITIPGELAIGGPPGTMIEVPDTSFLDMFNEVHDIFTGAIGGPVDVGCSIGGCAGYATQYSTTAFNYNSPEPVLNIWAISADPVRLFIYHEHYGWMCAPPVDPAHLEWFPVVDGVFWVWVADLDPSTPTTATIYITGSDILEP